MQRASPLPPIARHVAALLIALASSAAGADKSHVVEGTVRYVIDGDTLVLQPDAGTGKPIKLRLLGLDAPEICQAGGVEARDAIAQRLAGRRVQVTGEFEDDYHRRLATITVDGDDIRAGWCCGATRGMRAIAASPGRMRERRARRAPRGAGCSPRPTRCRRAAFATHAAVAIRRTRHEAL